MVSVNDAYRVGTRGFLTKVKAWLTNTANSLGTFALKFLTALTIGHRVPINNTDAFKNSLDLEFHTFLRERESEWLGEHFLDKQPEGSAHGGRAHTQQAIPLAPLFPPPKKCFM